MRESGSVVQKLETQTGVNRRGGETIIEYLDRVKQQINLDEKSRDRLESLSNKAQFGPENALTADELAEIESICEHTQETETDNQTTDPGGETGTEGVSNNPESIALEREDNESEADSQDDESSEGAPHSLVRLGLVSRKWWSRTDVVYLLPLIAGAVFLFFYQLGDYPLRVWDEGFYANLARHMVQDGYWLVPHMNYAIGLDPAVTFEPWVRLPPLGIWLQAVSMIVFGVNEFAVRLPTALASVLLIILVYVIGRHVRNPRVGFFSGVIFLTTPHILGFNAARDGALDILLILFGSLFTCSVWLAVKQADKRWLYSMGLFGGLAVLTKGFGAGVFVVAVLPLLFYRQEVFLSREMAAGVGITALLVLPWPIYIYSLLGDVFIQQFFIRYVFERAAGGAFGVNTNTLFPFMDYPYIKQLLFRPNLLHPWVFILFASIIASLYRSFSGDGELDSEVLFLIWWTLSTFVLFVFIGNKIWYILPMYVPAAVLIGREIDTGLRSSYSAIGVLGVGIGLILTLSPAYSIELGPGTSVSAGAILLTGVILVMWYEPLNKRLRQTLPQRHLKPVASILPLIVAAIMITFLVGVPPAGGSGSQQELANEVTRQTNPDETVFIQAAMENAFHTFSFYAERPLATGSISEFENSDIRYAVVTTQTLSRFEADTTVLMNRSIRGEQNVSLINVERQ